MQRRMSQAALASRQLVARLLHGERRAIAEVLTRLERQTPDTGDLIGAMIPQLGKALVVGITGPPGAGKSTLVNALIGEVRRVGRTVAVLAVDPSSPISGGAILGDRIRMSTALDDDGVFVRSLGSRGAVGGLTPAAVRMIDGLDAAGFGLIVIETVGTGQSEIDVAEVADVVLVVAAPGLGDGIQAMKAGLLEIADVLVVNKSDRPGADRTAEELRAALSLRADQSDVPVLLTSAVSGEGVAQLWTVIAGLGQERMALGLDARRRRRARYLIARAAADIVMVLVRSGGAGGLEGLTDGVLQGSMTPAQAAERMLADGL